MASIFPGFWGFGFWDLGLFWVEGIRVSDLEFRGFGFRVSGLGFRVSGLGFRVWGLWGLGVSGLGSLGSRGLGFRVRGLSRGSEIGGALSGSREIH